MDFEKVRFKGKFRDYQQRVLDNVGKYLADGKVNIVAAPGSGKTVLGLELIRRLNSACIILSPTTAIRQQWGQRFKDLFLDNPDDFSSLFSNDIHDIKLVNSITYQALYTAVEKVSSDDDGDTDCSDVDIFADMKQFGIRTICLDEAHHLKNEWQKALEKFISALSDDVKIISLTATPPYDSEGSEWSRYLNICGEIDEEIFVPELVGQDTLCPHQDYIYFNYPTEQETASFLNHRQQAVLALNELRELSTIDQLYQKINVSKDYETLFSNAKEYIALLTLLAHLGFKINGKLIAQLTAGRGLPAFSMKYADTAIQFLLDEELLSDEQKEEIKAVLKKYSLYEKKKVTLELDEKLKKYLVSSAGKLHSIKQIAQSEVTDMGDRLRMLVLTDYIKKESLAKITSTPSFTSVNVVSIFETLRRSLSNVNIGVLSGTLVILPKSIDLADVKHKKEDIEGTDYCAVEFSGSIHRSVDYVGKLFEQGKIQILVGTKSLLGEGWDSPCINSLILASFVGSFVLSNQMRGRAIRIDKNDPDKSANIWHLVTIEPEYLFKDKLMEKFSAYMEHDNKQIVSYDYDVLKRRFDSFMGPNYTTGAIESGIERITLLKPPYNRKGIDSINQQMLQLASKRSEVKSKWDNEVKNGKFAINVVNEVPTEKRVPVFGFINLALYTILLIVEVQLINAFVRALFKANQQISLLVAVLVIAVGTVLVLGVRRLLIHISPARSIKTLGIAVYKTLYECDLISSSCKVDVKEDKHLRYVFLSLRNATIHDQNVFNTAMEEMLSPIENPRYIIIAKVFKWFNYRISYACPSVIGKKKEYVNILAKNLKLTNKFQPVYTYGENGRKLILKCRRRSYITLNERLMNQKYKLSHWE